MRTSPSAISRWCLIIGLFCGTSWAAPAKDAYDQHFQHGLELYDGQQYEQAIRELEAAYQLRFQPRLLYLLGQAYRKMGQHEQAQTYFKEYLLAASPTKDGEFIKATEDYLSKMGRLKPAAREPGDGAQGPQAPSSPGVQRPVSPPATHDLMTDRVPAGNPGETARGPRPRWRVGIGAAAVGVGALVVGFGASALATRGTMVSGSCPGAAGGSSLPCAYAYDTLGIGAGLTGAGAALAIGGIVTIAWPGARRAVRGEGEHAGDGPHSTYLAKEER